MKIFLLFLALVLNSQMNANYYYKGKQIDEEKLKKLIKKADVIYVGEEHTSKGSHEIQLDVLKKTYEIKNSKICVGFEMLNRTLQDILDKYINSEISEEEFLNQVNWEKEWGFDFNLYKPIFDFIKEKKLKAIALNVPRKIVSKVARGGLSVLDDNEKKLIAKEINIVKDRDYNEYLEKTFYGHGKNPMNKIMSFDNYKLSMAVWNESMGEKVSDFLRENPNYTFIVIAGNGHIMYNAAIPWSVKKRIKVKNLSIYTISKEEIKNIKEIKDFADIIWGY